jgi:glycosyltransferase involved in cell wall biosynthesis
MKVLMTTDTVGGVWTYALELADALAPHGVRTSLAAMGPRPNEAQEAEVRASSVDRFEHAEVKLEWMAEPWEDVERAGEWLLALADEVRPDVVHLNGYAHGALSWEAPTLVAAHSCVLSWHRAVRGRDAPCEWEEYEAALGAGLAAADTLVAPTQALLDAVVSLYGPPCDAYVIPNGRRPLAAPAAKESFILSAGRLWDEGKNVAALDRVAPRLSWPVVLAGEGDASGGGARVLGRLSPAELGGYLARAAIYAAPARYEPFGLGALEAGLAACALVLGDIPSLREVWGDAALFVDPGDDDALASALELLIANGARRRDLGARARRRALTYSTERMAGAYVQVYERLVARSPAEAAA